MSLDRGPWTTTRDYLKALIQSEIDYLKVYQAKALENVYPFLKEVKPEDPIIVNTCEELMKLVPFFCPSDPVLERLTMTSASTTLWLRVAVLPASSIGKWLVSIRHGLVPHALPYQGRGHGP